MSLYTRHTKIWMKRYGTGSGSDRVVLWDARSIGARSLPLPVPYRRVLLSTPHLGAPLARLAPGRYRSRYRTGASFCPLHILVRRSLAWRRVATAPVPVPASRSVHSTSWCAAHIDRVAIGCTGRRAGSVPRAVASVVQREARSLPLAVLTRTRNCKLL